MTADGARLGPVRGRRSAAGGFEIENPDLSAVARASADLSWLTVDTPDPCRSRAPTSTSRRSATSTDTASFSTAYMVRAVSPGKFVLPGATIEDMYRPELRANTDAGHDRDQPPGRGPAARRHRPRSTTPTRPPLRRRDAAGRRQRSDGSRRRPTRTDAMTAERRRSSPPRRMPRWPAIALIVLWRGSAASTMAARSSPTSPRRCRRRPTSATMPVSTEVVDRNGAAAPAVHHRRRHLAAAGRRSSDVDRHFIDMLIAYEDRHFETPPRHRLDRRCCAPPGSSCWPAATSSRAARRSPCRWRA